MITESEVSYLRNRIDETLDQLERASRAIPELKRAVADAGDTVKGMENVVVAGQDFKIFGSNDTERKVKIGAFQYRDPLVTEARGDLRNAEEALAVIVAEQETCISRLSAMKMELLALTTLTNAQTAASGLTVQIEHEVSRRRTRRDIE